MTYPFDVEVRFHECDMYGHVNHAAYLHYLESARVAMLAEVGASIPRLLQEGYRLVIRRIDLVYSRSAALGDRLTVRTRVTRMRKTSGVFLQSVQRGEEAVVEATVEWACVDANGRPTPLPTCLASLGS